MTWRLALIGASTSFGFSGPAAFADPAPVTEAPAVAPSGAVSATPLVHCPGPSPSEAKAASEAVGRYYPERAMRAKIPGKVILNCLTLSGGTLGDCKIVSESPEGFGFGEAALKLAVLFKTRAAECTRADIPINFKLPK